MVAQGEMIHLAWNINLLSKPSTSAVPIPAAAWLFSSGLLGLATLARRRRS